MDNPLLAGESSNDNRSWGNRLPVFNRRTNAIVGGSPYQKAAALVDLAEDGVGLPEELLDQPNFEVAAKSYFVYTRFNFLWSLNYFALIGLSFFEKPLWCAKQSNATSCSDRNYYYLGELPYLTSVESLTWEGITFVLLTLHILFPISFEGSYIYWKKPLNRLKVILLLILVADLLVYILYLSPVALYYLPFRLAPYVRVIFFVLNIRELRESVLVLVGMLPTYLNVLALWLLFLLFSSWIAYVVFEDTTQGDTIFTSYGVTLYQMFILFTTSNNPDVWIPAYKASRWYCIFFIFYVLLAVYFVTNLILAVVYDSFKSQLAKQVVAMDSMRRNILVKAFNLIDTSSIYGNQTSSAHIGPVAEAFFESHDTNCILRKPNIKKLTEVYLFPLACCVCVIYYVSVQKLGYLNKEQCLQLFEELNKYRTLPKISREDFELIFDELDDSQDFKINLDEFADLCHAIALRFAKEDSPSCLERFPTVYRSPVSEKLKAFVRSPTFGYVVAFILVVNLIAVVVETTLDLEDSSAQQVWQEVEFVFGWIYVVEMALKVYAVGFVNYWRDGLNRFDFIITWVIVIGETATFLSPEGLTFLSNGEWIRYLILARVLRLIRLLMHVKRYRAFVATFLTLLPSLMPYLGTIFCIMCIYSSLGVQIFGGLVNVVMTDTEMTDDDYLLFNFNDYPNSMVTLFNLVVMGNWQVWMESYWDLTGTAWTLIYFISFYLITVLLILNLIVAFVLEAFFAEMELEETPECDENTGKEEEGSQRRRRYAGSKSRSQRVDVLLHHMLSSELQESQPINA